VARAIDEAWIEDAIERYQRVESLLGDFQRALTRVDVTVRSPDGVVEIIVCADGSIRDVVIHDTARDLDPRQLSSAVYSAVTAAADAARWARTKLHQDMFNGLPELHRPDAKGAP